MSVNRFINFSHFNIRSVGTNFDLFSDLVTNESFTVLGLSETWLEPDIQDDVINIPNYSIVRKDRNRRGGGVCFYVNNCIKFKVLDTPTSDIAQLEQLWISFKYAGKNMCLGTLYRPPNTNLTHCLELLENTLTTFIPEYDLILFGGDLNVDISNLNNLNTCQLIKFFNKYGLHQIILQPTHVTSTSSTTIDIIVTSNVNLVQNASVINMEGISDHSLVTCDLKVLKNKQSPIFRNFRDFTNFNYNNFLNDLFLVNWDVIFYMTEVDRMVKFWNDNVTLLFDVHAPYRTVRITKRPAPWLTENVRLMIKLKNKAFTKYKLVKSETAWNEYKELRNFVNRSVKMEKKAYLQYKFKSDPKEFWKTLKYLNINTNMKQGKYNIDIDPDMLNDYFLNRGSNAGCVNNAPNLGIHSNNGFSFSEVNVQKVETVFRSLKSNARGTDDVDLRMLNLLLPHLSVYLTFIINTCLSTGYFPTAWKTANIVPIPKQNNPSELAHFRPISILPVISKILEKIVLEQLHSYLSKENILPICQSGFRPAHSTATALLQVTDDIFRANDNNQITCLILLDFSKAFDTVNHNVLCNKLKFFGLGDTAILFFKHYLIDRSQRVTVNGRYSNYALISSGVPQGSILGPLLFSIYTADFCNSLNHCKMHQYADDTQIYYSFFLSDIEKAVENINTDLENICAISTAHCLVLNEMKTEMLLFGGKRQQVHNDPRFKISVNGKLLSVSEECKNLGVYIDDNLRFSSHVNNIVRKSYAKLKLLYIHKDYLSTEVKLKLCDSLILSYISYCDTVYWPALLNIDKQTLQKIQNACVRYCYKLRKFDHISVKFRETHWLNLDERFQIHMSCLIYKIANLKLPSYLFSKLIRGTNIHNRPTRFSSLYIVPKHNTAQFQRSFSYNSVKIYNKIPENIKCLKTVTAFRKQITNLIFSNRSGYLK